MSFDRRWAWQHARPMSSMCEHQECARVHRPQERTHMNRIIKVNVGGRYFQTRLSTLLRFPDTSFAKMFEGLTSTSISPSTPSPSPQVTENEDVFVDANPDVFEKVLGFLRTNHIQLPLNDEGLRAELVHHLKYWDLMPHAFPASAVDGAVEGEEAHLIELPDVCVVQVCDHMQHDQGVKRHAMTITYGADGFQLRKLAQMIRRDLNQQLSSTYWQCYQTNERAAFFATTKVANGAADILTTSITQQVVQHTERLGYHLATSYVTLSPDVVHTSVRMLIHNFIFRRVRLPALEAADEAALLGDEGDEVETYQNFEPRPVGPQKVQWADSPSRPPRQEVSSDLWK
ncbi:BTB/POZ domain containing protein, putative [Leishmania lindenbergi]|uniref:BTB/POZ domain containing protein n=1 Tax=Leishmania lindenbergi TaxID=651832 RepID=A0AAW3AMC7_9TRYP